MNSGFRRKVDEICSLLGYYAAYSGNSVTDVSGQPNGTIFNGRESRLTRDDGRFLTIEDGTDRLYRNFGNGIITIRCAISHKRAEIIYFATEAWNYAKYGSELSSINFSEALQYQLSLHQNSLSVFKDKMSVRTTHKYYRVITNHLVFCAKQCIMATTLTRNRCYLTACALRKLLFRYFSWQ